MSRAVFAWGKATDGAVGVRAAKGEPQITVPTRVDVETVLLKNANLRWSDCNDGSQLLDHNRLTQSGALARHGGRIEWIAAGANVGLCGSNDGTVAVWGRDQAGQLSALTSASEAYQAPASGAAEQGPIQVAQGLLDAGLNVRSAGVGARHLLLVTDAGKVVVAGSGTLAVECAEPQSKQVEKYSESDAGVVPSSSSLRYVSRLYDVCIVQVAAGADHNLFLSATGGIFASGDNAKGQLGLGENISARRHPALVKFIPGGGNLVAAAFSGCSSMCVTADGVYAWGDCSQGQLGLPKGQSQAVFTPMRIAVFSSASLDFDVNLKTESSSNDKDSNPDANSSARFKKLGTQAQPLPPIGAPTASRQVVGLALGSDFSLFLTASGTIWSCGSNAYGQLGRGERSKRSQPVPVPISEGVQGVRAFTSIAAGTQHAAAVSDAHELYTWGRGAQGQLGHASTSDELCPKLVDLDSSHSAALSVACGREFTIVLTDRMPTLASDFLSLLRSGELSDCEVVARRGEKLRAHRFILTRCEKWHSALSTSPSTISTNVPHETLSLFLEFAYSDTLPDDIVSESCIALRSLAQEAGFLALVQWCSSRLDVKIITPATAEPSLMTHLRKQLLNADDSSYFDFALSTGGISYGAHRAVLAVRSPYFQTLFSSGMRENSEGRMSVDDAEPAVLRSVLEYFYTGEPQLDPDTAVEQMLLAVRWQISSLQQLCEHYLQVHLDTDNAIGALSLADYAGCSVLRGAALDYIIAHFSEFSAEAVLPTTNSMLDTVDPPTVLSAKLQREIRERTQQKRRGMGENRQTQKATDVIHELYGSVGDFSESESDGEYY